MRSLRAIRGSVGADAESPHSRLQRLMRRRWPVTAITPRMRPAPSQRGPAAIDLQQSGEECRRMDECQLLQRIEAYWDADAEVYDTGAHRGAGRACGHAPVSAAERA